MSETDMLEVKIKKALKLYHMHKELFIAAKDDLKDLRSRLRKLTGKNER